MNRFQIIVILFVGVGCVNAIQLRGAGASFPVPVYSKWTQSYELYRKQHIDINCTYKSTGSGTGRRLIIEKADIEYAGSDSLLSEEQRKERPDLIMLPALAGGTVIGYNLPACNNLIQINLTRDHVVGIYNGTIGYWNDTRISDINPSCNLPNATIRVIARRDDSGTTSMFTESLCSFSPDWESTYGTFSKGYDQKLDEPYFWNKGAISLYGQKNKGVSGLLMSLKYTLGYLSVSDAIESSIPYARIQNRHGRFANPTVKAIQGAMDRWAETKGKTLTGTLSDQQHPDAYPIAGFTYLIVYKTHMTSCGSAKELVRYIDWFMTDKTAQASAVKLHMVPLSSSLANKNKNLVLRGMECNGRNVWEMVQADIQEENREELPWLIPVAVCMPLVLIAIGSLIGYILYQRWKMNKMIDNDDWEIAIEDIIFYLDEKVLSGARSRIGTMKSIKSLQNIEDIPEGSELLDQILQWPGKWQGHTIGIRILEIKEIKCMNRDVKRQLLWMRDTIVHTNVVRFFGLTTVDDEKYVIGEYCGKGPMTDILQDEKFNLTNDFKFSLATDIANGMCFLHSHGVTHGNLASACCLIDARWTVKVADWEYCKLYQQICKDKSPLLYIRKAALQLSKYAAVFRDFWVAPEIVRSDFDLPPSSSSDVYSYAIILQEIFTREDPYSEHADSLSPEEVLRAVVNNNLRPQPNDDTPINIRQIMEIAWSDNITSRPTFEQIIKMLRQSRSSRKSVLDSMMEAMEEYTAHLEERVEERTSELTVAKQNLETMMKDIIPSHLVQRIANGQTVDTRVYSSLGIIMAEVVNIREVAEKVSAKDLLQYLNDMYSEIETVMKARDTYRANLQGDTFTVVVGLQSEKMTLDKCAELMGNIALDILLHTSKVSCPASISKPIEFKLSAHLGNVATGLLGQTSPTFVVMGDSIDITKTLLANSTPSRVRVSSSVYRQISKKSYFFLEPAEEVIHQGVPMQTYWLKGRDCLFVDVPSDMSVDSGIDNEKSQSESRGSKSSIKSQGSVKSRQSSSSEPSDSDENIPDVAVTEPVSAWGLNPQVTLKPPKGRLKNKVHPLKM